MASRPPQPDFDLGLLLRLKRRRVIEIKDEVWKAGYYHFSLICPQHGGRLLDYGDKSEHPNGKHHRHEGDAPPVEIEDADFVGVAATRLAFYEKAGEILADLALLAVMERSLRLAKMYVRAAEVCKDVVLAARQEEKKNEQEN